MKADRTRLKQVLINLLSNAIKYNRPAGTVRVQVERLADTLRLSVVDSGVGIAPADQRRLFEPFNRLAHSRSAIEGSGIGLSVTRALVDLMHGRIEVHSQRGVGSTFSVTLPPLELAPVFPPIARTGTFASISRSTGRFVLPVGSGRPAASIGMTLNPA